MQKLRQFYNHFIFIHLDTPTILQNSVSCTPCPPAAQRPCRRRRRRVYRRPPRSYDGRRCIAERTAAMGDGSSMGAFQTGRRAFHHLDTELVAPATRHNRLCRAAYAGRPRAARVRQRHRKRLCQRTLRHEGKAILPSRPKREKQVHPRHVADGKRSGARQRRQPTDAPQVGCRAVPAVPKPPFLTVHARLRSRHSVEPRHMASLLLRSLPAVPALQTLIRLTRRIQLQCHGPEGVVAGTERSMAALPPCITRLQYRHLAQLPPKLPEHHPRSVVADYQVGHCHYPEHLHFQHYSNHREITS